MSVEPWIEAWPRRAMIPPPGRPMFPRSSWTRPAVRMSCTPVVCWVQPTAYTNALVLSRPEFAMRVSATLMNSSFGVPQIFSTISGVYRA